MSYGRDPDAASRAAGAIAAIDKANPARARAHARARAMTTQARDHALAKLTLAPRGGLSLGGVVSKLDQQILSKVTSPTTTSTSSLLGKITSRTPTGTTTSTTSATSSSGLLGKIVSQPSTSLLDKIVQPKTSLLDKIVTRSPTTTKLPGLKVRPKSFGPARLRAPDPRVQGAGQNPIVVDPVDPVPPAPTESKRTGTKAQMPTGGGGGGGGALALKTASLPALDLPGDVALPDLPMETQPQATKPGISTTAKVAIVGAVALAGFMVLRKRGRR